MTKKRILLFILVIVLLVFCALAGLYYHDEIENIIEGQNWNYIDSYSEINDIHPINCFGRNLLGMYSKEEICLYNNKYEPSIRKMINSNASVLKSDSNGAYTVLYVNESKVLFLVKNDEIVFEKSLDFEPKLLYTNENGYIALLYSQIGYKTGIKVYKPDGSEVITTYLANSYATTESTPLSLAANINAIPNPPKS